MMSLEPSPTRVMRFRCRLPSACLLLMAFGMAVFSVQAQFRLTEFMPANTRTLKDDFGQYEDWIEIFNAASTPVSLAGWALTDNPSDLSRWRFPNTNLPPRSFLIVFASGRDRRATGQTLHTNFRLDSSGEYLALIRPSGEPATEFSPAFPPMAAGISYGMGSSAPGRLLVTTNTVGRAAIPENGVFGSAWTLPDYDDAGWRSVTNGLGFVAGAADDPATVAEQILNDQPPGYWQLEEVSGGTTANRGSVGAIARGQVLGNTEVGIAGPRPPAFAGFDPNNRAFRMNGLDARIEIAYAEALNPETAFTVEAWVKPARAGASPSWIVSSLNVSAGRAGFALAQDYASKNQWEFRLGDTSGYIAMAFGGNVDTNRWQYLAGVYDGTTARLYIDGILAASATLARPFTPNRAQKLLIGGRIDAANPYYYAGDVDEVSVIDRALTAADIASRFQMATHAVASELPSGYAPLISTDLRQEMFGGYASVYVRLPFVLNQTAGIDQLTLRVKYDDGFVAFLNGVEVASANAPAPLEWNSRATTRHAASLASQFESFDLTPALTRLGAGTNLLAFQALNLHATNADLLLVAELESSGAFDPATQGRYFAVPTPGSINGTGTKDLGPVLSAAGHWPHIPSANDSLSITCKVDPSLHPIADVTLHWRVMFEPVQVVPMFDDGAHMDGASGDGNYGAEIPSRSGATPTYAAGQMVRYFVQTTDTMGRRSRWPLFENPLDSAEYLGTVVQPDALISKLPVFHLFAPPEVLQPGPNTRQIGADSEQGGRVSLFFDGEFYDNIHMELRGNTSAGLNKKAHRLEFNREHPFRHPGPGGRIRKTSLLAEHLDPTYLRQHLCFWLLELMGVPSPFNYPVRLQLNGAFYQLAFHSDVLGEEQLERLGYDPEGTLYKCAGQVNPQFSSTGGFQKLLPQTNRTDRSDYLQLANGIHETQPLGTRRANTFDLLDVAQVINYLAGARFCAENDDVWANMCLYRDTLGDGLWRIVPFDMNASWGQLYGGSFPLTATDDNSKSHPFYGGSQVQENGRSAWNRIYDVVIALPETRQMLLRRQRSLLDAWVFPPGTPASALVLESYIKEMTNRLAPEAMLDRQKWGFSPWAPGKTFPSAVNDLLVQFVGPRRAHWYVTHSVTNAAKPLGVGPNFNAGIPLSQASDVTLAIVSWDVSPVSGNQDEEFICITNTHPLAVDASGWEVRGGIRFRLRPGTVVPASGALYLSPNVAAFRQRALAPRGGMGLFVQGPYEGRLNAWGERLSLLDARGRLVAVNSFEGTPSPAQQSLRIVELMYNPAPEPGSDLDPQRFEYLALKNVSTHQVLNLSGIRFTAGIQFQFNASPTPLLQPGEAWYLVRDRASFTQRYGTLRMIAGEYVGALDSGGEALRLEDAVGEKILEFNYDNQWYPATDGRGAALQIVNELASWETWGRKESWTNSPTAIQPREPLLQSVISDGAALTVSFATEREVDYALEYKNDLKDRAWTIQPPSVVGTGEIQTFRQPLKAARQRFFRVRALPLTTP